MDMERLEVKSKKFQTKINQKKADMAILKLDKTGFRARRVTRNQEGHFTRIKGLSQHKDITICNLCV